MRQIAIVAPLLCAFRLWHEPRRLSSNVRTRNSAVIRAITELLLNALAGPGRELRAIVEPDLGERVAHMALDGANGEVKP
jgi:hypothetical protein